MERNFFNNFIRSLFANIDYSVYSLIEWVVQGIFDIANLRTSIDLVNSVRQKIYVILGIFMLFKITFALINYMLNPDSMSDREKGVSKLVSRTGIMLALLIAVPTIFSLLYRAQNVFLPVLPRFLLGVEESEATDDVTKTANTMSVTLLQAFFHPFYTEDSSGNAVAVDGVEEIKSLEDLILYVNEGNGMSLPQFGSYATYSYDYLFLVSTVFGVVVLVLLIGVTVDLAVRLFKLLVLEMLAPIPILNYIDPKSAKDGSAFQNWVKEVIKTFVDVFVKLGLVYLVLYFVSALQEESLFENLNFGGKTSILRVSYLKVFIIIGLISFLKVAPKFIRNLLGIKENKDGGSFIGNVAGGLAGFGAGAVSGAISGRGLTGAITGGLTGMSAGYQGAASGKPSNAWKTAGDAAIKARLGDKDAKSGLAAYLQRSATNSQMKREAAKLNLTSDSINTAKKNMIDAQNATSLAEFEYQKLLHTDPGTYGGNYDADLQNAYNEWQAKATESSIAEQNYNKGKEAYEKTYGQAESVRDKYQNGAVHRATKFVGDEVKGKSTWVADHITQPLGAGTIDSRRNDRIRKRAGKGGYDPEKRS